MDEPLSPLAEEAVHLRECFLAFLAAGFTEDQALRLVAYTLQRGGNVTQDGDPQ